VSVQNEQSIAQLGPIGPKLSSPGWPLLSAGFEWHKKLWYQPITNEWNAQNLGPQGKG